ncbi:MAG: hypothetical protein ACLUHE_09020 [Christensenellales bacterium]
MTCLPGLCAGRRFSAWRDGYKTELMLWLAAQHHRGLGAMELHAVMSCATPISMA